MDRKIKAQIEKIIEIVHEIRKEFSIEKIKKSRESTYAAVYIAVQKALNLTPYDEQLQAAICLDEMMAVQMQTGEGKTIAAVFPAVWNALCGKRVHILTFNDYLADRDYKWMKPVYDYLGITLACITSKSDVEHRKKAYQAQVLYTTAKEAGFDYLRDFVADTEEKIVQQELDFAIVDEADSIMIDEGRVPLVIAAMTKAEHDEQLEGICFALNSLSASDDCQKCYRVDLENRSVYLTDFGIEAVEKMLSIENLYDEENAIIRTKINDALKAFFMLKQDEDYILRNDEIVLIDEFTGRAAPNRHYPGFAHSALELKHGLKPTKRGKIMGMIALQFYLRRYKKLSGMTGTAKAAADEFDQLFGLPLAEIPTHRPMIRNDREMEIFTHSDAKWNAIILTIQQANKKGQPVLVGTQSITESQFLAERLEKIGIISQILNAKNDYQEAEIISEAGDYGKVTVTTSMAGRGVDIKLGGRDEHNREKVIKAGGLLVVCTFLAQSERINSQLNGRAGRQGDIGESRLFVSLEDEIFVKYNLKNLVPKRHYPKANQSERLDDKVLLREIKRVQRIAQGDSLDDRIRLMKYSFIGEKHRDITFSSRKDYLLGNQYADIWQKNCTEKYNMAVQRFGEDKVMSLQNRILCSTLNDYWSEYIDYTEYLKRGIHLMRVGGKSPSEEYNIIVEDYYDELTQMIIEDVENALDRVLELNAIEEYKVHFPQAVWTYLIEEKSSELLKKPFIVNLAETEILSDTNSQEEKEANLDRKKGFFAKLFGVKNQEE